MKQQIKKIKTKQNDKPTTGAELLKRTDIEPTEVKKLLKTFNKVCKSICSKSSEIQKKLKNSQNK